MNTKPLHKRLKDFAEEARNEMKRAEDAKNKDRAAWQDAMFSAFRIAERLAKAYEEKPIAFHLSQGEADAVSKDPDGTIADLVQLEIYRLARRLKKPVAAYHGDRLLFAVDAYGALVTDQAAEASGREVLTPLGFR